MCCFSLYIAASFQLEIQSSFNYHPSLVHMGPSLPIDSVFKWKVKHGVLHSVQLSG